MRTLGQVIREIRDRRGETMAQLAAKLGLKRPTISRYEADKLLPSRAVLFHLHGLAESAGEREVINAAIKAAGGLAADAAKDGAFIALAKSVTSELNTVIRTQGTSMATRENLRDLMVHAIGQKYVPLCLVEFLKLWRKYGSEPEAEAEFVEMVSALDRKLESARRK